MVCVLVLQHVAFTSDHDVNEVPDFSDRNKWVFVEEHPLIHPHGYEFGLTKKYRHTTNTLLVGFEDFFVGDDKPFWKSWGFQSRSSMYNALRKKNEEWTIGPPGNHWQRVVVYEGLALKGMWFLLFIPSQEEAVGRFFPFPGTPSRSVDPAIKDTGAWVEIASAFNNRQVGRAFSPPGRSIRPYVLLAGHNQLSWSARLTSWPDELYKNWIENSSVPRFLAATTIH